MLRPAFLLPSSNGGLSTPRSGMGISPRYLGSATRRSGAYRGGTLTRWRSEAKRRLTATSRGRSSVFVTTHHAGIVRRHAAQAVRIPSLNGFLSIGIGRLREPVEGRCATAATREHELRAGVLHADALEREGPARLAKGVNPVVDARVRRGRRPAGQRARPRGVRYEARSSGPRRVYPRALR